MTFLDKISDLFLSRSNRLFAGLFVVVVPLLTGGLLLVNYPRRGVVIVFISALAIFFAVTASRSLKMWVPALIGLMLIRDFSLGSLVDGAASLKIGDIMIAYLFTIWLLNEIVTKRSSRLLKTRLDLVIILFILLHFCSLLWSTDFELGLLRCVKLVRNFFFYIIIRELFSRDFLNSYSRLTISYVLTGITLLLVHTYEMVSAGALDFFMSLYDKATLTSVDIMKLRMRNSGGGFLITGPANWFLISGSIVFGSVLMTNSRKSRILKIIYILVIFGASVLVLSRSSSIMLFVILLLLFLFSIFSRLKKNIIAISVILTIILIVGLALGLDGIYKKRFTNPFQDGSWLQRVELYRPAIDAFVENPLVGIGVGSNNSWQAKYPEIGGNRSRIVHSTYLIVLSEVGLLGFTLFLFIIYFWMKYLWGYARNCDQNPYLRSICLALLAYSISYCVYISSVGEFEDLEPWLVMAIASAIKILKIPVWKPAPQFHKVLLPTEPVT